MGRGENDKDRDRPKNSSRSRSKSRDLRRKSSESPRRDRDYDKTRNGSSRDRKTERYYKRSRSPRPRYRRKTSRENSAENVGNVLYISNLSRRIKDDDILDKFSKYGKIKDINIVRDPFTKDSRGFGFVTYENPKDSEAALDELNKCEIDGKQINVEVSKRTRPHHSTPGIYLGPMNSSSLRRRGSDHRNHSPKRRHRSRSRSRSYKDKYYRRQRSRSGSNNRRR